jgi:hypothetical protein
MPTAARHHEVEERFRKLLQDAGLPEPDDVQHEPQSVIFFWHDQKVAVCVDLEHPRRPSGVV